MPVPFLAKALQQMGQQNAALAAQQQQQQQNALMAYHQFVNEHNYLQQLATQKEQDFIKQMTPFLTQQSQEMDESGKPTELAKHASFALKSLQAGGEAGFTLGEKLQPKETTPAKNQFAGVSETGAPLSYNPNTNTVENINMGNTGATTIMPKYSAGAKLEGPALDLAAVNYQLYGTLPSGVRNPAIQTKIITHAAELNQQAGITQQDAATVKIKAQTLKAEMQKNQTMRATIKPFEQSASKGLGQIEQLNKTVDRTGVPMLNAWINAGRRSVSGNPELSAFDFYINTFINDYARITTTVTGGGVTAQAARDDLSNKMKSAQNQEQMQAVIDAARFDMNARISSMDEYNITLKNELQNMIPQSGQGRKTNQPISTPTPTPQPVQPQATHKFNPATGKIEIIK